MKYAPMWLVDNNILYHYSDKQRAGKNAILKWVVMNQNYFIGTWQFKEHFAISLHDTEIEAQQAIAYKQAI